MEIDLSKNEIRRMIKEQKEKMDEASIDMKSDLIIDRLIETNIYKNSKSLLCYVSYNQEVNTYRLIDEALRDGKKVYVPKVIEKGTMEFFNINNINEDLVSGYKGILEPKEYLEKFLEKEALVIMPGLAFDVNKHRIGYGGGYYDRYLMKSDGFYKIAVCFDFQLLESISYEQHDLMPDMIITEKRIIV